MARPQAALGAAAFAALGLAFGYAIASAYLTTRFGGSLERIDFLFLARSFGVLRERAPAEFLTALAILGGGLVLGLGVSGLAANEALTRFGLTHWQTRAELRRNGFLGRPGRGFLLGKLGGARSRAPFLVSTTFPHALLVAPTGRGKGVGFVIPNLLTFKGSVVVLDVKGENFRETSRHRKAMGDRVIRFAPADWSGRPTHRYNPLSRIAELSNPDQQMMELRLTAGLFLQADSERVAGLLQGGINLFVAAGMLALERGRPTLGEIYRIAAGGGDKQKAYARLALEVKNPAARLLFESLASINPDTLTSYLSLLMTSGLDTWANPAIDATTAHCDVSFRELRRSPHAVYLEVAPEMIRPLAPLLRLFFSDLIASLQAHEPGPDEPWPVMILLDEFDRLGRMPIVAESIKTLRSYGAHLALVTQTIPALDEIYGENTRLSLQGGAGVKLYLTPSDPKTIAELSAAVGRTTRRVVSKSRPLGPSPLKSRTLSERTEDAPLLSEDQARTMSLDDVVLVIDAQCPIRAKRIKYYEDPVLRALHAAQSGELPYPDPATSRLDGRVTTVEQQIAALAGSVARLTADRSSSASSPEPAPAVPVSGEPTGQGAANEPNGAVSTGGRLVASARRSRVRQAVRTGPSAPLEPTLLTPADAPRLREATSRLSDLLNTPAPATSSEPPDQDRPARAPEHGVASERARLA